MAVNKKRILFGRFSLKVSLAIFIIIGAAMAFLTFIAVRFTITRYVDTVYLNEENKKAREDSYIADFQNYITENSVTSEDNLKFSEWVKEQKYVYMLIYKDDELFYASDDEPETPDDKPATDNPATPDQGTPDVPDDGEEKPTDTTDKKPEPSTPGGSITVTPPTYEQLKEYAEKKGQRIIELADGPVRVKITEFSEYLYYDISNITAIAAAVLAFSLIILIFFIRIVSKISRLAADVNRISEGDMDHAIKSSGNDELSSLSRDVDKMRNTILHNLRLEREARAANEELITSMSHDIRTPLTVLLGYLDIMKTVSEEPQMNEYIKASENTALRLKKLSDDMFNYFLVFGNENEKAELQEYEAEPLLDQLLSEHVLLLREKGYVINAKKGNVKDVMITTDAPATMRIMDNLFSNLSKYADLGEPITIKTVYRQSKLHLIMENILRLDSQDVESNGIGLKTCKKLAEIISLDFDYKTVENKFTVSMAFQAAKKQ